MGNKFASFMLAVVLAFGMVPSAAFAVGDGNGSDEFTELLEQETSVDAKAADVSGDSEAAAATVESGTAGVSGALLSPSTLTMQSTSYTEGDFTYTVSSGLATITGYTGSSSSVTVPDKIGGYLVTSIGYQAFCEQDSLVSLTLPSTLQSISISAFEGCAHLVSVNLPESLTSVGSDAFKNCTELTSVVVECGDLGAVTNSGKGIFANAGIGGDGIQAVFTSTCTRVPNHLFVASGGTPKVVSATIASSVTEIGYGAFQGCTYLESVVFEGKGLTEIGYYAFEGCTGLREIDFPSTLKSIAVAAFRNCTSLTSITLPESLGSIVEHAFANCTSLEEVVVNCRELNVTGDGYTWYYGVFQSAGSMSSGVEVTFGSECTVIPAMLFEVADSVDAPNVKKITVLSPSTTIGDDAFGSLDDYTIYGYTGSTAYDYAMENDVPFVSIGEVTTFSDVADPAEWYYDAVYYLVDLGVVGGYTDAAGNSTGKFGPMDSLTRAQLVTMLWRYACPDEAAAYDDDAQGSAKGTDYTADGFRLYGVDDGQFYTAAANWAVSEGVVTGFDNGDDTYDFAADRTATFEEVATIIARMASGGESAGYSTSVLSRKIYTDGSSVASWAASHMAWCLDEGVVSGVDNGNGTYTLAPGETLYRARFARMLYNAIQAGVM